MIEYKVFVNPDFSDGMFPKFHPSPDPYNVHINKTNTTEFFIELPEIIYHPEFEPDGEIISNFDGPISYENQKLRLSNFEELLENKRYTIGLIVKSLRPE